MSIHDKDLIRAAITRMIDSLRAKTFDPAQSAKVERFIEGFLEPLRCNPDDPDAVAKARQFMLDEGCRLFGPDGPFPVDER